MAESAMSSPPSSHIPSSTPPPPSPLTDPALTATTTTRRANPPSLNLETLQPFARRSNDSTSSSRFLTPPISIASISSPPPRREADDYLTSSATHHHHRSGRGKHHARNGQRSHSSLIYSEETGFTDVAAVAHETPPAGLDDASIYEVGDTRSTISKDMAGDVRDPPSSLVSSQPESLRRSWQLRDSLDDLTSDNVQARFMLPSRKSLEGSDASPAVAALRRLSRSRAESPPETVMDLQRFSRAFTGTFGMILAAKDAHGDSKASDENVGFLSSRRDVIDTDRLHTAFEDNAILGGRRATPATITLRKASGAYQPLSSAGPSSMPVAHPEATADTQPPFHILTSTSNLLAFSSKRLKGESPSISSSVSSSQCSLTRPEQSAPLTRRSSSKSHYQPSRTRARSSTLLSITATPQRYNILAETAVTTAEIYPSPGMLISPCSLPDRAAPDVSSFRTSVVQFVSRSSVHEIIWRENETSSSGSSASPVSPHTQPSSGSKPPSVKESHQEPLMAQPPVTLATDVPLDEPEFSHLPSAFRNSAPSTPGQLQAQEALFGWTWDHQAPPNLSESPAELHGSRPPSLPNSRKSTMPLCNASTFHDGTVHSFPPLDDRRSTSEWRKKSLVDIHDPRAGRPQLDEGDEGDDMGRDGDGDEKAGLKKSGDLVGELEGGIDKKARSLSWLPFVASRVGDWESLGRTGNMSGGSYGKGR